ncbi:MULTISPECIES: hypothetical protein [Photorhabdus]|uniref:Uncharacterized protein n=1 Tax=Photorhabdus akhurstii TaxID=171438 RepID=A0ABX8LRG2_9GAMM|nr:MULTISPECIES: hypothetical protein [Photorhabdus]KGM26861.1 hypothetical protein KS18_18140 [Photorhabdus luminescens]MBS9429491.1 hypothetical protein [Photorhabdus akhurstii]MCC8460328.1 hypothetical protein [Photorhabdus aegyptia]QXF33001.1 hypothetical protein B0X70_07575 [Photorhabdus akhurstii]UJD74799.1 hypothetical protein CE143_07495 [Photorhabdus luminescens]
MARVYINPNQTLDIYKNGSILVPAHQPHITIKNVSLALVKVSGYWASLVGDYTLYNSIEIYPGRSEILIPPPNLIYYYKVTATNLASYLNAEIEVEVGSNNNPLL